MTITDEEYEEITEEAGRRLRRYSRGIRGQMITKWDGIDAWVIQVCKERYSDNGKRVEIAIEG